MQISAEFGLSLYGACVATGVALWNVFVYRRDNRVRLAGSVNTNAVTIGGALTPVTAGKKYIVIYVSNHGTVPCQVNSMCVLAYKNLFNAWRGRLEVGQSGIIVDPMSALTRQRLPYRLERGNRYIGMCEQTKELEELSRTKYLYAGVNHSMADRPFRVRVRPISPGTE